MRRRREVRNNMIYTDKKRQSIRLKNYDYSKSGLYFVTICTENRECLFGDIIDGKMVLNNAGNMIEKMWNKIPERFNVVKLDESQIMPNHVHGIIIIKSNNVGVSFMKPEIKITITKSNHHMGLINQTPTLGLIIRYFKSKCTYEIHKNGFNNDLWQRNYYKHVIRREFDLNKIREYINTNPQMWERDRNNPKYKNE